MASLDEIKPFEEVFTLTAIKKKTEEVSIMWTKQRKIRGVQGLAEGMDDVEPEKYTEVNWILRYWGRARRHLPWINVKRYRSHALLGLRARPKRRDIQ